MDKTLEYYNKNAVSFAKETINADMHELYEFFLKYLTQGASILDLGCGSGRDAKYFLDKGYIVTAIDGSPELCRLATDYTGQPVICKLFNELEFSNDFDGVWACASLLHLTMNDLIDVLQRIKRSLKNEGILYTSFKYGDFSGYRNDRYFTDLDENKLMAILGEKPLFKVLETKITSDVRPGRENEKWLNVILKA